MPKPPFLITILDGYGHGESGAGNAIAAANKPTLDLIDKYFPMTMLQASGEASGMLWGEPGNSEVGHINIGAGRPVYQYSYRVTKAIKDGSFYEKEAFLKAIEHAKKNNSNLHITGLLTSGIVHASFESLEAIAKLAKDKGITNLYFHLFADGKDSGPTEAKDLLIKFKRYLEKLGIGSIVTMIGRNKSMDRQKNWNYTKETYELMTQGKGQEAESIEKYLDGYYAENGKDTYMPAVIQKDQKGNTIKANDALIVINFREDSMRQFVKPFIDPDFKEFEHAKVPNLFFAGMTLYEHNLPMIYAFDPPNLKNTLGEIFSNQKLKQLRITEAEKFAHVTFFFNGLVEKYPGEDHVILERTNHPDEHPEMHSDQLAGKIATEMDKGEYDVIIANFPNSDIVAHTGNFESSVKAIEAVDKSLAVVLNKVIELGGTMVLTADHGNAESLTMRGSGEMATSHDKNPVHFFVINEKYTLNPRSPEEIQSAKKKVGGILADVAPTVLDLMGIKKPVEMTGQSLLPILGIQK